MNKYLVQSLFFSNNCSSPIVICDTKEDAQKYIDKLLEGKEYNGLGYYDITSVKYIKKERLNITWKDILEVKNDGVYLKEAVEAAKKLGYKYVSLNKDVYDIEKEPYIIVCKESDIK